LVYYCAFTARINRFFWGFFAVFCALAIPFQGYAFSGSGSIGVESTSYFGPVNASQRSFFPILEARGHAGSSGRIFEFSADAQASVALNDFGYCSFEAPELYFGTSPRLSPVARVQVGRKLADWSLSDRMWNSGFWQGAYRWDYLAPVQVGLIGAFLEIEQPVFKLLVFGSPVFIPERGTPLEFKNGSVSSKSKWFIHPGPSLSIFGRETRINYTLVSPPLKDIILHPGGGVYARLGGVTGPWVSTAYAFKPMNQLLLAYDGYLDIPADAVDAMLYPRVVYHHILTVESGYKTGRFNAWLGVTAERPVRDETPEHLTTQEVSPALTLGPSLTWGFGDKGREGGDLGLSYLRSWGGDDADQGPFSTPGKSTFESRYQFQNAVLLSGRTGLGLLFGKPLRRVSVSTKFIYDIGNFGRVLMTGLDWHPLDELTMSLGADILSSDGKPGASGADFINRYRTNDRVHAGVAYAF